VLSGKPLWGKRYWEFSASKNLERWEAKMTVDEKQLKSKESAKIGLDVGIESR